jgi:hypothetical protein
VDGGSEATVALVDDSVSASSRARVDAKDFHEERLERSPDIPAESAFAHRSRWR